MFTYLNANRTAGYSGFIMYHPWEGPSPSKCIWMIPGTFFDDWDNQ